MLIDLDDTLIDTAARERATWPALRRLLRARIPGLDLDRFDRRYRAYGTDRWRVDVGQLDYDSFRRARLRQALAPWVELDDELFSLYLAERAAWQHGLVAVPDARPTVARLRRAGLRLAVVTNGPSAYQREKLDQVGLAGAFDSVVVSADVGIAKPDGGIFAAACARLGVPRWAAAMIGDTADTDIRGALDAGLAAAVWLRRGDGRHAPYAALRAGRLGEAPALLGVR